jgi:hypothetical protein
MPKPTSSPAARRCSAPAALAFEQTRFYGAYLDGTDLEAFEHYQDAQPQYSEDGAMVYAGAPLAPPTQTPLADQVVSAPTGSPSRKTGVDAIGHPMHARTAALLQKAPWNGGGPVRRPSVLKRPASCLAAAAAASSSGSDGGFSAMLRKAPWNGGGPSRRPTALKRPASRLAAATTASTSVYDGGFPAKGRRLRARYATTRATEASGNDQ